MSKLTKQEIFDKVATHLLTQGRKSQRPKNEDSTGLCLYRGPGGLMCAAGILIDDEDYHPGLESQVIGQRIYAPEIPGSYNEVTQLILKKVHDDDIPFVRNLQNIHDMTEPKDWRARLFDIAANNDLGRKVLDAK